MPSPRLSITTVLSFASLLTLAASQAASPQSPDPQLADLTPRNNEGPYCVPFKFTSADPSFSWKRNGLCSGTTTGSFNGDEADCCFSGSGAMFVGPSAKGLGDHHYGNTIIECTIAPDASGQSVCDISLIDGFSLPVECGDFPSGDPSGHGTPEAKIGGTKDLGKLNECKTPCQMGEDCTSCLNDGHGSAVDKFFTDKRAGNYWFQDSTAGKSTFIGRPKKGFVECRSGAKEEGNAKRSAHLHTHKRAVQARRLHHLLGGVSKHGV